MPQKKSYPKDVFTSLTELLELEHVARSLAMGGNSHKVKSLLAGKHASSFRGRGLDFEEVRNYVKGDDIRNIDWKVTARTKKTHTRVFSEEKEKPALIVVDQSASMFFGSQKRTKAVAAAELAAITAFKVLKEGDRVGGIVFANEGIDIILPKRDRRNTLRFLEKIVDRNHELAYTREVHFEDLLNETFSRIRNLVTHDFLVVVISDFYRYSPKVIKFIAQIAQHNDVILAKVSDPLERDIPNMEFIAGDHETQVTVEGKDKKIRQKFARGFDENLQSFQQQMRKYRIPVLSINTTEPISHQLKTQLLTGKK